MDSPNFYVTPRYNLLETIGQGGMGIVYRATDRLTGEIVALKRVTSTDKLLVSFSTPTDQTSADLRLSLAHEFQILAGLRHPHIISVLDYGFDATQQPFFTMNYLPEARTILAAGKGQPLARKLELLEQLLQALAYLHRRDILHRDLKPENILVSHHIVRVLDFGLSASPKTESSQGGTAFYTAPEIWNNQPYTAAADLFATGIIACEILVGHHPFHPLDQGMVDRVLTGEPDLHGVEPKLAFVICQLLAKDPVQRLQQPDVVLAAIAEATGRTLPEETSAIREGFLQAATFVGRKREMDQLTAALKQTRNGQGSGWLIGGESGVGKSRLINELKTRALVEGFVVLHGQGLSDAGAPYQLWREPLRHLLVMLNDVNELIASILQPLVPDIAQLLGRTVPPAPDVAAEVGQRRLMMAIAQLFRQYPQPVLLILEDLQWVEESLLPLAALMRGIESQAVMVVASYREEERPFLPQQLPQMQLLKLGRLSDGETAVLARSILGPAGQQPEMIHFLQRETEGNTFFLVEVVRVLAEEAGRLQGITPRHLPARIFPEGVRNLVFRRLQHVPPQAQPLLHLAALAGRELSPLVLTQLAHEAGWGQPLENWLQLCAETAVIEVQENRWRFSHDKLREALLQTIPAPQQRHLHRKVATAKETCFSHMESRAAEIAFHWQMAGDAEKELLFAHRAGAYALQNSAHQEAIRYLNRALQLCPATAWQQRYELLWLREEVYGLMGNRPLQAEDLAHLAHLANQLASPQQQIETALRQSAYDEKVANYSSALQVAEHALKLAQEADLPVLAMQSKMAIAWVYTRQGKLTEAQTIYEDVVFIFHQLEQWDALIYALIGLGMIAHWSGNYQTALAYYEEGAAIGKKHHRLRRRAVALNNLGLVFVYLGNYAQAQELLQQALDTFSNTADWLSQIYPLNNLALIQLAQQDYQQARLLAHQALEISLEVGDRYGEGRSCWCLGHVYFGCQNTAEAATYWERSLIIHQELNQRSHIAEVQAGLAQVAFLNGNPTQTLALVEKILSVIEADPSLKGSARPFWVYLSCIELLLTIGDNRAIHLLKQANDLLNVRAAQLQNSPWQTSFLQADVVNSRLISLYTSLIEKH